MRSTSLRAGLVQRARIVLLASQGVANARIAAEVGTTTTSVWKWRKRYSEAGLAGLDDAPRSGRPKQVDDERIIAATLRPPPKKYGVTHWSSRLLATHLGIGNATVARAWRTYGVQPWRAETFKFSTDPELVGKVTDVVGLYLAPPENAIVLCVDELCDASHNRGFKLLGGAKPVGPAGRSGRSGSARVSSRLLLRWIGASSPGWLWRRPRW